MDAEKSRYIQELEKSIGKEPLPPLCDKEAEGIIVGTLLYHPEFLLSFDYLNPNFFYDSVNGCFVWAIQELFKAGVDNIDVINIEQMLNSNSAVKKKLEKENLADLSQFIDLARNVVRESIDEFRISVNQVVTLSYKREFIRLNRLLTKMCEDDKFSLKEVSDFSNERLIGLAEKYIVNRDLKVFGEVVDDLFEEIEDEIENGFNGLKSKIPLLENFCTYDKAEMVFFSADKKQGKSAYALNETLSMLLNNVCVIYFDTEMTDKQFLKRMLANLAGVDMGDMKFGRCSAVEKARIKSSKEWIKKQLLYHFYLPDSVLNKDMVYISVKSIKLRMDAKGIPVFVIYDYIKSNKGEGGETANILGDIADFLKNKIAGELKLPVLALGQRGRSGQVADSDKIERYVSTSILWRAKTPEEIAKDGKDCGNYVLQVVLNRNGDSHGEDEWIDVVFNKAKMQINQAKEQHVVGNPNPFDDYDE